MKKLSSKSKQQQVRKAGRNKVKNNTKQVMARLLHEPASRKKEQAGYDNSTPGISKKVVPTVFTEFQQELNSGRHNDIVEDAKKGATFEECIGTIAARLDIILDGDYTPEELFSVLLAALRRRVPGSVQPHQQDGRLVAASLTEMNEFDEALGIHSQASLEERADAIGVLGTAQERKVAGEQGPYTICRGCDSSFECCTNRSCKLGTPATQLGNTVKTLDTLRKTVQ